MSLQFNLKKVPKGLLEQTAPGIVEGILDESLRGKTVTEFYEFVDGCTIWDMIPQGTKQFLLNIKPWDLSWLTKQWILKTLSNINPTIAILVMESPELQEKFSREIDEVKEYLT